MAKPTIDWKQMQEDYEKSEGNYHEEFSGLITLGGLWKVGDNFESFIGGGKIVLVKNLEKNEDNKNCDYFVYFQSKDVENDFTYNMLLSYMYLRKGGKKIYLSGRFANAKLLIFANDRRDPVKNHPHYIMNLAARPIPKTVDPNDVASFELVP